EQLKPRRQALHPKPVGKRKGWIAEQISDLNQRANGGGEVLGPADREVRKSFVKIRSDWQRHGGARGRGQEVVLLEQCIEWRAHSLADSRCLYVIDGGTHDAAIASDAIRLRPQLA